MAKHPRGVEVNNPGKGQDSSKFGRRGEGADRVASKVIPEKRDVREPDQNFPTPASIDHKRNPRGP